MEINFHPESGGNGYKTLLHNSKMAAKILKRSY